MGTNGNFDENNNIVEREERDDDDVVVVMEVGTAISSFAIILLLLLGNRMWDDTGRDKTGRHLKRLACFPTHVRGPFRTL